MTTENGDPELSGRTMVIDATMLAGAMPAADLGPWLVFTQDGAARRVRIGAEGITIGRVKECDIVHPVAAVSRQHCRVTLTQDGAWVTDLGSTNGTLVDGERISGPTKLAANNIIQLGGLELRYVELAEDETISAGALPRRPAPSAEPRVTARPLPEAAATQPVEPERRLAAIMVTDVVGFSRMMGIDEVGTLARMAEVRTEIVDPAMAEFRGRIFKEMGDGLLAVFSSAVLALSAANRIQLAAAARNARLDAAEHIVLRIGVHQGEVLTQGTDLMGDGVNVAARLEPLATPGGICVSDRVREDVGGKLLLDFEDIGEVPLKNIGRPVRVHRVHQPGMRPQPPPPPHEAEADASAEASFTEFLPVVTQRRPTRLLGRNRRLMVALQAGAAAVALGAAAVWWNWDALAHKPLIGALIGRIAQKPIVAASPGHLTIALAHLEGDRDDEHEKLLLDRLTNDFEGAYTTQIDRMISLDTTGTAQDALNNAKEEAGVLRAEAGADVLLWGRVVTLDGKSVMRLYWTTGQAVAGAKASGVYGVQADTIALPELFWSDLKQVLGLLLQSRLAVVKKQLTGHYAADQLAPLIAQVRKLLQAQQGNWGPDTDAKVRFTFADALSSYGDQAGNDDALRESIDAYTRVLTEWTRESAPLDWARAQHSLGNALVALGQREDGTARYEAAVAAYRAALQERTRARVPLDWAQTENGLGNALEFLGERETGTAHLEESVTAYRAALEERTRDRVPLDWARVQNNLGEALLALGQREPGTGRLHEAVNALRAALEERTRARVPLDWADTQNNLATALQKLAARESGDPQARQADLEQSMAAVDAALEEWTKAKVPFYWAMAQETRGDTLRELGARGAGTEQLQQAATALRGALDVFTRDEDPLDWGDVQHSLGVTLRLLGERDSGTTPLHQAEAASRAALTERTRARAPLEWARTEENLGRVLQMLAARENDPRQLTEAVTCLRAAVDGYQQAGEPDARAAAGTLLQQAEAATAKGTH